MKKQTVSSLKKKLDKIFSQYIRARDNHVCITCGKKMEPNESQNGHYVSRLYTSLRWDEINNNCQCVACNVFKKGHMDVYAIKLRQKHGQDVLEQLHERKYQIVKLNKEFLLKKITFYSSKLKEYAH